MKNGWQNVRAPIWKSDLTLLANARTYTSPQLWKRCESSERTESEWRKSKTKRKRMTNKHIDDPDSIRPSADYGTPVPVLQAQLTEALQRAEAAEVENVELKRKLNVMRQRHGYRIIR